MDVRLYCTADGGEIDIVNGQLVLADGLETAAYLSMFGGNEDDSGTESDDPLQWWGNWSETEEARKCRSQTQHVLIGMPLTSGNLILLEEAAQADLAWMLDYFATDVVVSARVVAPREVELTVEIEVGDSRYTFTFETPWNAVQ